MASRRAAASAKVVPLNPPPKPRLAEIGQQSLLPFTWYANEEAYDFSTITIPMLEDMLDKDGQAQSLYRLVTMPLRAATLSFKPAKDGQAESDFINATFFNPPTQGGLQIPWSKTIAQIARAVLTGSEVLEQVFEIRDGIYHLTKIAPRQRTSLIYLRDDRGEFNGVRQFLPNGLATISLSNCFRYVVNPEANPLFGKSMFLPAYYHYEKKHKLYYTSHIAYAIAAAGIRVGTTPEGATQVEKDEYRRALDSIGFNTTLVKPEGFGFDLENPGAAPNALPLIDHHDNMMAKGVLGQVIEVGTGGGPGSFAVGQTHMDLWLMAEEALMSSIAEEITNQIVAPLIDWNFGSGSYPIAQLKPNYQDKRAVIQSVFERIASAKQVNTTADFWLEIEKAIAEELGFAGEIDYTAQAEQFKKDFKSQQKAARAKPTPKPPTQPPTPGGNNNNPNNTGGKQ
jgi:hypothetical protein